MDALGTDFDAALTGAALAALAVAALWCLAVVLAVALEARTGGRVQIAERTGCPQVVRRWLLGVFVALFAVTAPAQASDSGSPNGTHLGPATDRHPVTGPGTPIASTLNGLPLPDRASGRPRRGSAEPVAAPVVVRSGDSLWRIARERLPGTASDSEVARAVRAFYAANRRQIGPDPDQIQPGQHLDFPDPTTLPEEP